jgi:hypothetical protein
VLVRSEQGCINSRCQAALATTFGTVVANICGFADVTVVARRIVSWLLGLWRISAALDLD